MIGRVMNISGTPFLAFGYNGKNGYQGKKKKDPQTDFGDILKNEMEKKKSSYVRRLSDDA